MSDTKDNKVEQCNIVIASAEVFTKMLLKDETNKLDKEKEKVEVLEVENEILSILIRNEIAEDNNHKEKINELQVLSDKKDMQPEQSKIIIASAKACANMLLIDENKNKKER